MKIFYATDVHGAEICWKKFVAGADALTWAIVILVWVLMVVNYVVAAAIYFGFSAYRRRQGVNIDKVYKQIPVE